MIRADLHIHSSYSHDGTAALPAIVRAAKRKGLDAIAVCDHNVSDIFDEIAALCGADGFINGLLVLPGVEYSTSEGHLLALFLREPISEIELGPMEGGRYNFIRALDAVQAAGGLAILAHPHNGWHAEEKVRRAILAADGAECCNARLAARVPGANHRAAADTLAAGKCFTAGSDAHVTGEIGNACFMAEIDELTDESLRAAVEGKRGDVWGRESLLCQRGFSRLRAALRDRDYPLAARRFFRWIPMMGLDFFRVFRRDRGQLIIKHGSLAEEPQKTRK